MELLIACIVFGAVWIFTGLLLIDRRQSNKTQD